MHLRMGRGHDGTAPGCRDTGRRRSSALSFLLAGARQLPRAMFLALAFATAVYVAVALGVFGTLTVNEVIASGGTALAEAAKPTLGQFGYVLMVVTALF